MRIEAKLEVERELGGFTFQGLDGEPDSTSGFLATVEVLVSGEVTEERVVLDDGLDLETNGEESDAMDALWWAYVERAGPLPYVTPDVTEAT